MLVLRTADELKKALHSLHEPALRQKLQDRFDQLTDLLGEYDLADLATFVIAQPGDDLARLNDASDVALVQGSQFAAEVETAAEVEGWLELTFVLSDDGYGIVLYVPDEPYPCEEWQEACETAKQEVCRQLD